MDPRKKAEPKGGKKVLIGGKGRLQSRIIAGLVISIKDREHAMNLREKSFF